MKDIIDMTSEEIREHLQKKKGLEKKRLEHEKYLKKIIEFLNELGDKKISIEDLCKKTKIPRSRIWFFVKFKDIPDNLLEKMEIPVDWK